MKRGSLYVAYGKERCLYVLNFMSGSVVYITSYTLREYLKLFIIETLVRPLSNIPYAQWSPYVLTLNELSLKFYVSHLLRVIGQ
jgi:hypothetical protein